MAIFFGWSWKKREGSKPLIKVTKLSAVNRLYRKRPVLRLLCVGASCSGSGMADAVVLEISADSAFTVIHELLKLCVKDSQLQKLARGGGSLVSL